MGTSDDLTPMAVFLASSDSDYVRGADLQCRRRELDELMKLSNATLDRLPDTVRVPRYDRRGLTPGIVHIGVGNFHRAHQSWYLHRLMQQGLARDWAIVGAGVRPYDAAQREKLLAQDCLTTLTNSAPPAPRPK